MSGDARVLRAVDSRISAEQKNDVDYTAQRAVEVVKQCHNSFSTIEGKKPKKIRSMRTAMKLYC